MANLSRETFFAVTTEDKPGMLLKYLTSLREAKVDLRGMWGWSEGNTGKLLFSPKDPAQFKKVASTEGWKLEERVGFRINGDDRPGSLVDTLQKLNSQGINLGAMDAISVGNQFGGYLFVGPSDVDKAAKILGV